jgi:uncharacterized protein YdaU (DUF1376 family)
MTKPPAFQFYARDFEMGTAEFTIEEVGIYIRLLCFEWDNGTLPNNTKKLAGIARCPLDTFNQAWEAVKEKFVSNGSDRLINERMEEVRKIQDEYRQKQSESGKKGIEAKKERGIYPFTDKSSNPSSDALSDPPSQDQALQSSSATPSSSESSFKEPSKEEISESSIPKIKEYVEEVTKQLYDNGIFTKVHAFKHTMKKRKLNERAILHALCRCYAAKPKDPWAYCEKIMQQEDGSYNARQYEKTHPKES